MKASGQSPGATRRIGAEQAGHRNEGTDCAGDRRATRSKSMMDILMLALGFVFFALAIGYTYACERL
jgi:preprotein translocase subunit SecG